MADPCKGAEGDPWVGGMTCPSCLEHSHHAVTARMPPGSTYVRVCLLPTVLELGQKLHASMPAPACLPGPQEKRILDALAAVIAVRPAVVRLPMQRGHGGMWQARPGQLRDAIAVIVTCS